MAGLPCCAPRGDCLSRVQAATGHKPFIALLGGPRTGRTTAARALLAAWEGQLRQPTQQMRRVPVLLDMALMVAGAEHLTPAALDLRFVRMLYAGLSEALANPFVQPHGAALRIPNFTTQALLPSSRRGASEAVPNPWTLLAELCQTIWRSLVGTAGSCRVILLIDNADLLLEPRMRHLQTGLRQFLEPPAPPPEVIEPPPQSPRERARGAPIKGENAPGRAPPSYRQGMGRASQARRQPAAATEAKSAPAPFVERRRAGAPPSGRFARRIGDPQLGSSVPPGQRPAAHLPPNVERPLSLICIGGPGLARQLHAQRRAHHLAQPLWRNMQRFVLPPLRQPEVDALLELGALPTAAPLTQAVLQQVGGHPYVVQIGLQALWQRRATLMQAGQVDFEALIDALSQALHPYFTELWQTLHIALQDSSAGRILRALDAAGGSLSWTALGDQVGGVPLQPAVDILCMAGLMRQMLRGDVTECHLDCQIFRQFIAATA